MQDRYAGDVGDFVRSACCGHFRLDGSLASHGIDFLTRTITRTVGTFLTSSNQIGTHHLTLVYSHISAMSQKTHVQ